MGNKLIVNCFLLLRPHQWLKNLILFFPPFLNGSLFSPGVWQKGVLPFIVFSAASSSTYIFNDLFDREADRLHPRKKHRALASGRISLLSAIILGLLLLTGSVLASFNLTNSFGLMLVAYLGLSFAYSASFKNIPVLDIFCIASGFVLRLFSGGEVFSIAVSDWLFLSVLLLALFLSAGKRLGEKNLLGESSNEHRKSLDQYPDGVLEGFMFMTGASVLMTYSIYAVTFQRLIYSVPLCCYGLFRYIMLIKQGASGEPTDSLLRDPQMLAIGVGWVSMVAWAFYL